MAESTISLMTAVLAANLDDTALLAVDDKNGNTRKATIAQLRTQLLAIATMTIGIPTAAALFTATSGLNTGYAALRAVNDAAVSLYVLLRGSTAAGNQFGALRAGMATIYAAAPMGIGTTGAFALILGTNDAANITIASGGVTTIHNLAGVGARQVIADANGVLSAP